MAYPKSSLNIKNQLGNKSFLNDKNKSVDYFQTPYAASAPVRVGTEPADHQIE